MMGSSPKANSARTVSSNISQRSAIPSKPLVVFLSTSNEVMIIYCNVLLKSLPTKHLINQQHITTGAEAAEVFDLLACYASLTGSLLVTFWDSILVPPSRVTG
jgi:hypothetical protein